ncbi:hypothetical protein HYY69_03670 [Candidatus Woesearchaeota archaeon]|nr:hypothetical protein [Candidatus Woesearchaeota archaeon]
MLFKEYLLLTIILYLTPVIGMFLAFIAPEELTSSKKYLHLLQKMLVIIAIILLFYTLKFDFFTISLSVILFGLALLKKDEQALTFYLLSFILFAAVSNILFLKSASVIIFIFGMSSGILCTTNYEKNKKINQTMLNILLKIIIKYLPFIVLALVLALVKM